MSDRLFDSSAIINLCSEKKIDHLVTAWTLDLAFYEIGNAVWRQVYVRKSLSREKGDMILDALMSVLENMNIAKVEDALGILKIAVEEGITYYDASYLFVAIKNSLALVTDDEKLYNASKKYIKVSSSKEI